MHEVSAREAARGARGEARGAGSKGAGWGLDKLAPGIYIYTHTYPVQIHFFRATVQTFNLGHIMLIQRAHGDWVILRLTGYS
jgi:hypothetical protein